MSILFSQVTLNDGNAECEFLMSGIPREADDMSGWTAYENFMEGVEDESEVAVHVEAYLYGGGETVRATPEEVAYMYSRIANNPDFLSDRCDNIEDVDFTIPWSPDELFGQDFVEL